MPSPVFAQRIYLRLPTSESAANAPNSAPNSAPKQPARCSATCSNGRSSAALCIAAALALFGVVTAFVVFQIMLFEEARSVSRAHSSSQVDNAYINALYGGSGLNGSSARLELVYKERPDRLLETLCLSSVKSSFDVHAPSMAGLSASRGVHYTLPVKRATPLPSDALAEVTHCGGSMFEHNETWHYVMRGSGLFVRIGKTKAFETHDEASKFFLNRKCKDRWNADHRWSPQCNQELHSIMAVAASRGFDSLQFTGHCDARCGSCGHELVMLRFDGSSACPRGLQYYSASGAPCKCIQWGASARGGCAMCDSVARALDRLEHDRTWPPARRTGKAIGADGADGADGAVGNGRNDINQSLGHRQWSGACAVERDRARAMRRATPSSACTTMDECLPRLRQTLQARGTLANRTKVRKMNEHNFEVCTEFQPETRFCELGYGAAGEATVSKKSCMAPDACYRFHLGTILEWASAASAVSKTRNVCNIAMRGHTLACDGSDATGEGGEGIIDGYTIVYGKEEYGWWDKLVLKYYMWRYEHVYSMIGTSHSGGLLLTYAMMKCKAVNVYGMGLYSNTRDLIYQHYYDGFIEDSCPSACWTGDRPLPNSTRRDIEFFQKHSSQVCRPHTRCDATQRGVPRTEDQVDFFIKSELKLHILHAFGILKWHV